MNSRFTGHLLMFVATCSIATGCTQAGDAERLGRSVGALVEDLRLTLKDGFVIYEPPGMARGVIGSLEDGTAVWLYFRKTMVRNQDFTFDDVKDRPVIGIVCREKKEWMIEGEVIWHYHSD